MADFRSRGNTWGVLTLTYRYFAAPPDAHDRPERSVWAVESAKGQDFSADRPVRGTRQGTTRGTPHDAEILAALRRGDAAAYDGVVRAHTSSLLGVAQLIVGDADVAQDVVQDVLITVWEQRTELRITGTLGGYLARAVRNRAISVLRHERAERRAGEALLTLTFPFAPQRGSEGLEAAELSAVVRRTLDALPPRCREIFLMNRSAGLSYAVIAETLSVDVATVHTQMYRATKRLIEAIRALS